MKEILKQVIKPAMNFFSQIIGKEARRVNEFNNLHLDGIFEKEVKDSMESMSTMRRDFVASNLRSQLNRLQNILNDIEVGGNVDCQNADISLKEIEIGLRQVRKLCLSNN